MDRQENLVRRIRNALGAGMDLAPLHDHFVPKSATEEEFFLAYHAAKVLDDDTSGNL